MAGDGDRPKKSGRRAFFRLGLDRLRDSALDAARELSKAANELQATAGDPTPSGPPQYHRDRVRRLVAQAQAGRASAELPRPFVRPPGALPERAFIAACERCRKCVEACPEDAIVAAGPQHGPRLELTPMVLVTERPCVMCEDVPCAAACPTGALVPLAAADIRMGLAVTLPRLCLNTVGEACDACLPACPRPGVALRAGADGVPMVDDHACSGCGQCVGACKAFPKALHVTPR